MENFIVREDRLSEKARRSLQILDSIRLGGEVSRADISKVTNLNIVTVSNYVTKYVKDRIVFETGLDISTGGRRPELLKLNSQYGYSIGIDLGSREVMHDAALVGIIMDISGKVLAEEKIKKQDEPFEVLSEKVLDIAASLVKKSGIQASSVKGIGIGIWGIIDRFRMSVRCPAEKEKIINYSNLVSRMKAKFNAPVFVEHDAALSAFGEKWAGFGAGSVAENLIFLCADSSCGFIIRGELYHGSTRNVGELSINFPYSEEKDEEVKCWAGSKYNCCLRSRGIDLGAISSFKAYFAKHPEEGMEILNRAQGLENITFDIIADAARRGNAPAGKILKESAEYLGTKIAFLINLFNPEIIIIGRGIEKGGEVFFSDIRKSAEKWAYAESMRAVKIVPTSLGENVVAIGAGALVIQKLFSEA